MIGLLIAIVIFNYLGFKYNRLTQNQTLHIWSFTIAFQGLFDMLIEYKYHGYWYFSKEVEWRGVLAHTILIPPVNMLFLSFFPFRKKRVEQVRYIFLWTVAILCYEALTLLPEPWGYFYNGWWTLWHSAAVDPILFFILLAYFKWVLRLELLSGPGRFPNLK
ncbi:hypothetical protein PZE06_10440 [Robertmurraya sp. DFI.2.37]|uniref:hypothetical protein n=1 Tax=Robertmurraya TaxID=2837507 RepID=UPI000BA6EFEF|nr:MULTISPECIES: hypothetical protein [Robertmurraya]MDF1508607.1 hypothetical protein [Robertmurraya sp. DFI.2.37]PAE19927.1 hypothetical protein CHH80_14345 [Bacillus sp. 7504-2]